MSSSDFPYRLERVGVLMRPDPHDHFEVEGVLNPAAVVAPDGRVLMFPRVVGSGNRSRIARTELLVRGGVPTGVRRQGILLAPDRQWERGVGHGGVEDPRLTRVDALDAYLMTYVAFGPLGPRAGLLASRDLEHWQRLGPIQFGYDDAQGFDLNLYPNKDAMWFPEPVTGPDETPCLALLHRPMWELWNQKVVVPDHQGEGHALVTNRGVQLPEGVTDERAAIWISYVRLADARADLTAVLRPWGHRQLASSRFDWEALKIGAGAPPLRVPEGWLLLHHGVAGVESQTPFQQQQGVRYCAGAMLLDAQDPTRVLARTSQPLLEPQTEQERTGTVADVVFPTAIVALDGGHCVLYGMADRAIGVARLVPAAGAAGGPRLADR